MEGIILWVVIALIWAAIKGVFSGAGGDESSSSEEVNKFTVKVKTAASPQTVAWAYAILARAAAGEQN